MKYLLITVIIRFKFCLGIASKDKRPQKATLLNVLNATSELLVRAQNKAMNTHIRKSFVSRDINQSKQTATALTSSLSIY